MYIQSLIMFLVSPFAVKKSKFQTSKNQTRYREFIFLKIRFEGKKLT